MRPTTEERQNEPVNPALAAGPNTSQEFGPDAMLDVYGHGPTRNPFYEQARALNPTAEGALLIISTPVNRGQKLLLMSAAGQAPVEAEVVRTRTLDALTFEVEIAFPAPQPDFWSPFRGSAKSKRRAEKRRFPRVELPQGMTISWQGTSQNDVSRVSSLSLGGAFIEAPEPAPAGDALRLQFDTPSGAVCGQAVVRRSIKGRGMGVEFTELAPSSRAGLNELVRRLLGDIQNRRS